MGLFDKLKPKKEAQWFINKMKGGYELTDKFLRLNTNFPKKECVVFYKDITDIRYNNRAVVFFVKEKKYIIAAVGGVDPQGEAESLYTALLEKISEYK